MKIAVIFAGQGAQTVGMTRGIELYPEAKALFETAEKVTGLPLLRLCSEGPQEELNQTVAAQPALYTQGVAIYREVVRLTGLRPEFCAGLSLGEFTAHCAAGSVDFESGLRLVAERARAMQDACGLSEGGMTSLIGATVEQAYEIARLCDVDVANFNSPGQIVLSGERDKLERVPELAKERGIKRTIPLKVSGAFHSRLMQPAAQRLASALRATRWARPVCPVVANVTAAPVLEPSEFPELLERQVTGSVRWDDSIRKIRDAGVRHFLEIGPGQVLAGLNKRIDPVLETLSCSDFSEIGQVAEKLLASDLK